ncbi:MAG: hypothetical protein ACRC0B_07325 [Legionella sp.]
MGIGRHATIMSKYTIADQLAAKTSVLNLMLKPIIVARQTQYFD